MKKFVFTLAGLLLSCVLFAQESTTTTEEWDPSVKRNLLIIFAALCLFFAIRTFRGKPEA